MHGTKYISLLDSFLYYKSKSLEVSVFFGNEVSLYNQMVCVNFIVNNYNALNTLIYIL